MQAHRDGEGAYRWEPGRIAATGDLDRRDARAAVRKQICSVGVIGSRVLEVKPVSVTAHVARRVADLAPDEDDVVPGRIVPNLPSGPVLKRDRGIGLENHFSEAGNRVLPEQHIDGDEVEACVTVVSTKSHGRRKRRAARRIPAAAVIVRGRDSDAPRPNPVAPYLWGIKAARKGLAKDPWVRLSVRRRRLRSSYLRFSSQGPLSSPLRVLSYRAALTHLGVGVAPVSSEHLQVSYHRRNQGRREPPKRHCVHHSEVHIVRYSLKKSFHEPRTCTGRII